MLIDLAEKLVEMAPEPMSKAYFTNSGSEANDTLIKMIWYRSNALGQPQKKKLISRQRGYHGVTVASGSLTGLPNNHRSFDMPIERVLHTTCPHYWREGWDGENEEDFATRCADDLDALIVAEGVAMENIAIIEERGLVAHAAEVGDYMRGKLAGFADHPNVGEVRGVGLIAGVEIVHPDPQVAERLGPGQLGAALNKMLLDQGVISRAMIDALAFCPPLIIEPREIDLVIDGVAAALETLARHQF